MTQNKIDTKAKTITIFGQPGCSKCEAAKAICVANNRPYIYIDISENDDNRALMFAHAGNVRSLPQVLVNDKHIGGFDELKIGLGNGTV